MVLIADLNFDSNPNILSERTGKFQTGFRKKDSKTVNFFELLYDYPARFKIKWNALDELKEDLFLPSNYDVLEHSLPFIDYIDDWLFSSTDEESQSDNRYNLGDFREGFIDKRISSSFYRKQTKEIQNTLASVPIYVVLNGLNEIVLNKPRDLNSTQQFSKFLSKAIYNYCGAFDSTLEQRQQLGFFFMNRLDAETYLQEIARSDMNGIKTVGLTIHCIGLDSAYNITREHHPGIDFRIIPNLQEVKNLLTKQLNKSSLIVEDGQQQLRFRRRNVNIFPILGRLGSLLSPSSSFLQKNEYFKGVPIYIIQTSKQYPNLATLQYFNIVGFLDSIYGRFIQYFDSLLGCGHNWIMQGSLKDVDCSNQFTNFIFFDELSATKFINKYGRKIVRFKGSRTSNVETIVRKPKIFVYNLEDFIESWEDKLQKDLIENEILAHKTIFNADQTIFIPPYSNYKDAQSFFQSSESNSLKCLGKSVTQTINVKCRVFKSFIGLLFSVGYE